MPDMKLFVVIALLSTTLCATICTGCGGGSSTASVLPGDLPPIGRFDNQAIADIASTPAPDGVDQALWKELATALADALAHKQLSDAPVVDGARVNDLAYTLTADPQTSFTWSYRNPGDYDQNGEVNVTDIAQIVRYYLASSDGADWASAQVADGDGNGEVNVADISAIVQNYLAVVSGYTLQTSDTVTNPRWTDVGQVELADASIPDGGGIPRFSLELAAAVFGNYYRVVPFERTTTGEIVRTNTGATGVPVLFTPDARGDWHTLGHDAQHTSLSTHEGPTTNHVYWKHEIGGKGKSGPVYNVAGTIYVGGGDGLYAIHPDHTSVWVYTTPETIETSPAIARDGTVYFGCNDGVFRALYPGGGLKWSFTTGDAIRSSPVVAEDGTVYFGCDDGNLYALAPDGELEWVYETEKPITFSPTLTGDGHVLLVANGDTLVRLESNGQVVWGIEDGRKCTAAPMIGSISYELWRWNNNSLATEEPVESIVVPRYREIFCYPSDIDLAALVYRLVIQLQNTAGGSYSTPAMGPEGGLYFFGSDRELSKFNQTGAALWDAPNFWSNDYYPSPSVDALGRVFFGSGGKQLMAVNPENTMQWSMFTEGWVNQQVAIADSTIYAVDSEGWLYAIGGPLNATVPDVPDSFYFVNYVRDNSIELRWHLTNGAEGYEVFRDSESNLVATLGLETKFVDTGLETGSQHEYWLRAFNNVGPGGLSPGVLAYTNLTAPQNVVATASLYPDKIVLSWDSVLNATSYGIYRDEWNRNYEPDVIVEGQTTFVDTAITDWDTHLYFVTAINSSTKSYGSAEAAGSIIRGVGDSGAGSWNQSYANAGNTNQASVAGPTAGELAWIHQPDERFSPSSAAVPLFGSAGAVYLPDGGNLRCLNPDGSPRWSALSNCKTPVVAADGAIITSRGYVDTAELVVLNSDGTDRLVTDTIRPLAITALEDGTFIARESESVVSFNLDSSINWRYSHEVQTKGGSPTVSPDGTIYFLSSSWLSAPTQGGPGPGPSITPTDLNALNPDGTLRWVKHYPDSLGLPVVGPAGKVYFWDTDGEQLVVFNADGSEAWAKAYPDLWFYISTDTNGTVYLAVSDGTVDAYLGDGTLKWSNNYGALSAPGFVGPPLLDANGKIYLVASPNNSAGSVIACNQAGDLEWSITRDVAYLRPATLDDFGRLFFGGKEQANGKWKYNTYCIGPPM